MSNKYSERGEREPMAEAEIRAHTIGNLKPLVGEIRLADYDPRWPELFRAEAERIVRAMGQRALRIEHIGSTAVPGLAAKPIVDILLVVKDSANEALYAPDLEGAGYTLRIRERDWHEHRMFLGPDAPVHLHVFSEGCPEIERLLRFRDRLRNTATDRDRYEQAKRDLVRREWRYMQNYADAKSGIVKEILGREAEEKE